MKYMLIALLLAGLLACKDKIGTGPVAIHYGEDSCSRCGMIISDKHFAAELITGDGHAKKYDDTGCMIDDLKDAGKRREKPLAVYVNDYNTGEWLDAGKALYLQNAGLKSPMGYNIAAFGSTEEMNASALREDGKELGGLDALAE